MLVYRLLKAPYDTDPLSVIGAEINPGRWNTPGKGLLYTASSPALALLETMVNLETVAITELPALTLFTLEVADSLVKTIPVGSLPPGWNSLPPSVVSRTLLEAWIENPENAVFPFLGIGVPSAVLTMSTNYIFAPRHSAFASIRVVQAYPVPIDPRLSRLKLP